MTVDEWLEANIAPAEAAELAAVRRVIGEAERHGGEAYVTEKKTQVGLRFPATTEAGSVVALEVKADPAVICLPLAWLRSAPPFEEEEARQTLLDELTGIVGEASSSNLRGYASFPAERLTDGETAAAFDGFVGRLSRSLTAGTLVAEGEPPTDGEARHEEVERHGVVFSDTSSTKLKRPFLVGSMLVAAGTLALRALGKK